ncbi:MAG: asparagine synthase C-terminal domain-containing protein, partial [Candidatus Poseidoniales archaeon]|nr:asparagine synthase C-terminal domain-containing protein [Candidatus Poseidoniales archaeon]
GSYLSGGLDSTIVAGLAEKPHTWTVGFDSSNEFEYARIAADTFNSQHTEVRGTIDKFVPTCTNMIIERREPLSVPNEVLLYWMTRQVKKKNTVVLSGEGADELFFGYDRIFRWAAEDRWDIGKFTNLYSYGSHQDIEVVEDALAPFVDQDRSIDIVSRFFQIAHLHGLLRRLDNSTMRCSVEARVPFVDHRIIERMAGVPFDQRMPDEVVKAPLKAAFVDLVPEIIINRKKIGFPVPLAEIDFPGTSDTLTPMDRWLEFNLHVLTEGSWVDISADCKNTKIQEATG